MSHHFCTHNGHRNKAQLYRIGGRKHGDSIKGSRYLPLAFCAFHISRQCGRALCSRLRQWPLFKCQMAAMDYNGGLPNYLGWIWFQPLYVQSHKMHATNVPKQSTNWSWINFQCHSGEIWSLSLCYTLPALAFAVEREHRSLGTHRQRNSTGCGEAHMQTRTNELHISFLDLHHCGSRILLQDSIAFPGFATSKLYKTHL